MSKLQQVVTKNTNMETYYIRKKNVSTPIITILKCNDRDNCVSVPGYRDRSHTQCTTQTINQTMSKQISGLVCRYMTNSNHKIHHKTNTQSYGLIRQRGDQATRSVRSFCNGSNEHVDRHHGNVSHTCRLEKIAVNADVLAMNQYSTCGGGAVIS